MSLLQKLFGDKSSRDIKEINPVLHKTLAAYEEISKLSNDQLREKTVEFKKKIAEAVSDQLSMIEEIKVRIEEEEDIMEREKLWEQIDKKVLEDHKDHAGA